MSTVYFTCTYVQFTFCSARVCWISPHKFLSCAEADMTQMSTALVGLLDMMEAAKKIDSTEWETFPPPM